MEDVAVLKKELVQVQMLMDKMTLEREKESEKLKDECNHLRAECSTSEVEYLAKNISHVKININRGLFLEFFLYCNFFFKKNLY